MKLRAAALAALAALAAVLATASVASARCAPIRLPDEVRQTPIIVEAVVESAGDPASFRTVTVWKGGDAAPATFRVGARQGRGYWPWREASSAGQRYLLFLTPGNEGVYTVRRCGSTGAVNDATRRELRERGLTPHTR